MTEGASQILFPRRRYAVSLSAATVTALPPFDKENLLW
jgi:hypothetical protein